MSEHSGDVSVTVPAQSAEASLSGGAPPSRSLVGFVRDLVVVGVLLCVLVQQAAPLVRSARAWYRVSPLQARISALHQTADRLLAAGDLAAALASREECVGLCKAEAAEDDSDRAKAQLSGMQAQLGQAYAALGDRRRAVANFMDSEKTAGGIADELTREVELGHNDVRIAVLQRESDPAQYEALLRSGLRRADAQSVKCADGERSRPVGVGLAAATEALHGPASRALQDEARAFVRKYALWFKPGCCHLEERTVFLLIAEVADHDAARGPSKPDIANATRDTVPQSGPFPRKDATPAVSLPEPEVQRTRDEPAA